MDGAPGIGCPVIASLTGTDLALIVTEPTPSGRNDMERIAGVTRHFKVRTACCINKFDLNRGNSEMIEKWCRERAIPIVGKIFFNAAIPESVVRGVPYVEFSSNSTADYIRRMWSSLLELIA